MGIAFSLVHKRLVLLQIALLGISFLIACGSGSGGEGTSSEAVSISGQIMLGEEMSVSVAKHSSAYKKNDFELISSAYAQELNESPLVGATVELIDVLSGVVISSVVTNSNGEFVFLNVPQGDYTLNVSHPTIEPVSIQGVTVFAGDTTVIRGEVTTDGSNVLVDFEVDDCGVVVQNAAQHAHASNLAEAAGVPIEDVIAIRETQCLGWGQIAHQLGVPSSTIGLGNPHAIGGGKPSSAGERPKDSGRPDHAGKPNNDNHAPNDNSPSADHGRPDKPGKPK